MTLVEPRIRGRVQDAVVIVTGGANGLGRAYAEALSGEGARVIVADLDAAGAGELARELGPEALGVEADVASPDSAVAMVDAAVERWGRVDVLVNNAGTYPHVAFDDISYEAWQRVLRVNLDSAFLCSRAVLDPMRAAGAGKIINVATNLVWTGLAGMTHYIAAKSGVVGFTRALARELGRVRHHGQRARPGRADPGRTVLGGVAGARGADRRAPVSAPAADGGRPRRPAGVPRLAGLGLRDGTGADRGRRVDDALSAPLYDPFSPSTRAAPHAAYRRLREAAPLWWHPQAGLWFASSHAAVDAVLRDPGFSAVLGQQVRRRQEALPKSMLTCDPPDHTRLRAAVAPAFSAARLKKLRPALEEEARRLAAGWTAGMEIDVVDAYAVPLATAALGALLGVTADERQRFRALSALAAPHLDPLLPPEPGGPADAALATLQHGFADVLGARLEGPGGGDALDQLVVAFRAGDVTAEEVLNTCGLLVVGGFQPLVDLIAFAVRLALAEPGGLVTAAARVGAHVEETLRFEAPVHFAARVPVADTEVAGVAIGAGQPVVTLLAAANRDPERFTAPDAFAPGRQPNPHLAFGAGVHGCLGAGLSRLVVRVAIESLAEAAPGLSAAGEPAWRDSFVPRGLAALPAHA